MGRLTDLSPRAGAANKEVGKTAAGKEGGKKEAGSKKEGSPGGSKNDSGKEGKTSKEGRADRSERAGNSSGKSKEKSVDSKKADLNPGKGSGKSSHGNQKDQQRRDSGSSTSAKDTKVKTAPEKRQGSKVEKKSSRQPEKQPSPSFEKSTNKSNVGSQAMKCEVATKEVVAKKEKDAQDIQRLAQDCMGTNPKDGAVVDIKPVEFKGSKKSGQKNDLSGLHVSYRDKVGNEFDVVVVENSRGEQHSFRVTKDGATGQVEGYRNEKLVVSTPTRTQDGPPVGVLKTPMAFNPDLKSWSIAQFPEFDIAPSVRSVPSEPSALPGTKASPIDPKSSPPVDESSGSDRPERDPPFQEHAPKDSGPSKDTVIEGVKQGFEAKGKLDAKHILDRANGRWLEKTNAIARSKDLKSALGNVSGRAKSSKAMQRMLRWAKGSTYVGYVIDAGSVIDDIAKAPTGQGVKVGVASATSEGLGIAIGAGAGAAAGVVAVGLSLAAFPAVALVAAFSVGASVVYNDLEVFAEDKEGQPQSAAEEVKDQIEDLFE